MLHLCRFKQAAPLFNPTRIQRNRIEWSATYNQSGDGAGWQLRPHAGPVRLQFPAAGGHEYHRIDDQLFAEM